MFNAIFSACLSIRKDKRKQTNHCLIIYNFLNEREMSNNFHIIYEFWISKATYCVDAIMKLIHILRSYFLLH